MARSRPTGIERSRATTQTPDHVTKFYDSLAKAEAAAEKYRNMAQLNADTFRSPIPTRVADDPARIEFALLPAECSVDEALTDALRGGDPVAAVELSGQAGRALATIHNDLSLATTVHASRSPALRAELSAGYLDGYAPVDLVVLHGDFGFSNVGVDSAGELVIYDPEPSNYTTGAVNCLDYPEIDLATFVTCLAGRSRGLANVRALRRSFPELRDGFLGAYREARTVAPGRAFDRDRISALVTAQGRAYRAVSGRRSGIAVAALARWAAKRVGAD